MFLDHFKMSTHPFCDRPAAEQFLRDDRISQGLARLEYAAAEGVVGLLIGQTGVGKSSLLRLFIQALSRNRYQPLYLHLTPVKPGALLRMIVCALGERPRIGKDRLFAQILDKIRDGDKTVVLIVDEAHLLSAEALVDLRLLVSSGVDELPLKIVLSGQESLRHLLAHAALADLVQRISVRCHLRALTREQTCAYIDFRLRGAGVSEKLFEPEAKGLIHDYAGGIPRLINNFATACLINAAARREAKIGEPLVGDTMTEFQLP